MSSIVEKLRIDRHTPREEWVWRVVAKEAAAEIVRRGDRILDLVEALESIKRCVADQPESTIYGIIDRALSHPNQTETSK